MLLYPSFFQLVIIQRKLYQFVVYLYRSHIFAGRTQALDMLNRVAPATICTFQYVISTEKYRFF